MSGLPFDRDEGDSRAIIFQGASVSDLSRIFKVDARTIGKAVLNVPPAGTRRGFPVYHIRDVAPFFVKPKVDVETFVRNMKLEDLPATLNKEIWAAKKAQLDFEAKQGELWPTDRVVFGYATIFRIVQMAFRLIPDDISDAMEFDDSTRKRLEKLFDAQLENIRESIIKAFQAAPDLSPGIVDFDNEAEDPAAPEAEPGL